ncbi:AmmeMemoRadiSam system protein B [Candidatus Dojkabacteria bacterium]|nr:AmmeMemoRadiSam system protein B [Candidatus Dojkabacteria bacterium]
MNKRKAKCSGSFYPDTAFELSAIIDKFLNGLTPQIPKGKLKALIVPHAGYIYSGKVAAHGYAEVKNNENKFKTVVVIGLSHSTGFWGVGLSSIATWKTPLGEITQDSLTQKLETNPGFSYQDNAHEAEHSVEVQLPFLQTVLKNFKFTPILTGNSLTLNDIKDIAVHIKNYLTDDTLIIVSTDLSHYLSYETAIDLDKKTISQIMNNDYITNHEQACGIDGINILLSLAKILGWKTTLLKYENSGDVTNDKGAVVGYCSIGFYK